MKQLWSKDRTPHLIAILLVIGVYVLVVDTRVIEWVMLP